VPAYVTTTELRATLARDAGHPEGTAAELAEPILQMSLDAAQAQVDARLGGQYAVPFAEPVPQLVKSITLAIAAYLADLGYRQSVDSDAQDPVARRYQWATDLLSRLSTGSAVLPGAVGGGAAIRSGMFPVNPYDGGLFAPDDFDLSTSSRNDWWRQVPTGTWAGPWDN
jgi:phage gp36-like protein